MSGGFFDYKQYHLNDMADRLQCVIDNNDNPEQDDFGEPYGNYFSADTVKRLKETVDLLTQVSVMVHRADWLLSGDDGEESYHERLEEELTALGHISRCTNIRHT